MAESAAHVRVIEETSAYWRVLFDYPPFNIVDATIFEGLQDLLARMDVSPSLRVAVFESANPEFYLAHFDLTGKTGNITTAVGPSGLPILMDTFVRLTKSPVVSIAKIRGCVRGVRTRAGPAGWGPEARRGLHSVQPEKSLHHRDRARWVLFLRRVAEIIKDCEYAAGDIAVEAFGVVRRDQAVAPPPEDKGRQLQFWDAVRETAGLALPESINQRTTVAFALVDRDGAIDHLEGHATGVTEDVVEALLDQAAGQRVCQQ
jgi:hypothetical protein